MKRISPRILILTLCAVLLIAAVPFVRSLSPAADSKITLGPVDFSPNNSSYTFIRGLGAGYVSGTGTISAPVHLLGSKLITKATLYYEDDDPISSPCMFIYKTRPATGEISEIDNVCSSGITSGQVSEITIPNINIVISPSETVFIIIGNDFDYKI